MTIKLKIDGAAVEASEGSTVLDAARGMDRQIPTMCETPARDHITSCMICAVKDLSDGRLIPACSAPVKEGMEIDTSGSAVRGHRKAALELLLSEHVGDCEGPCRRACPAYMDIPEMLRLIACGDLRSAVEVVKEDIPIPGILGRICPAPCERICRRGQIDGPVGICELKKYVADEDLRSQNMYVPAVKSVTGHRVAVIGAGPAGLSAAYFLRRAGHEVVLFEKEDRVGGSLLAKWAAGYPDLQDVVEAEAQVIASMGVSIRTGQQAEVDAVAGDFDATIVATGTCGGVETEKHTFATARQSVFAIGAAVRPLKMAVVAVSHASAAVESVGQYLAGDEPLGIRRKFDSRLSIKLGQDELAVLQQCAASHGDGPAGAAGRCMQCDCLKKDACRLRDYSEEYGADQNAYGALRVDVQRDMSHPEVVFEPGKCIKCGRCVEISREHEDGGGLGFVGRGAGTKVSTPPGQDLSQALPLSAAKCAESCPTGAIALRRKF